jgi:L-threonylcarbamoyladenylate synthase
VKTRIIPISEPNAFEEAFRTLQKGGLVAFPTDTVYGVAALVNDPAAIAGLFEAKNRQMEKAIPVLLGSVRQIDLVAGSLPDTARLLAKHFWPGALTLVVPKKASLPEILSPLPTVGLRMPDHPAALRLLALSGPLAVTSANLSGGANPLTAGDVLAQLDGRIDLILDGGKTPGGIPSTVVDCTVDPIKILRQGAISEDQLRQALNPIDS